MPMRLLALYVVAGITGLVMQYGTATVGTLF